MSENNQPYDKTAPYSAEVIADSLSPYDVRLTSLEVTFPRMVLAEFNTHRVFSRNSASSRAIPVLKQVERALKEPFIPLEWGVYRGGMQSEELLKAEQSQEAEAVWLEQRDLAVLGAVALLGGIDHIKTEKSLAKGLSEPLETRIREIADKYRPIGDDPLGNTAVHKQFTNRLLEPFMWHTVLVTATEWDNFNALRDNADAQPEIRKAAQMMIKAYSQSLPVCLEEGQWHTPLVRDDEAWLEEQTKLKVSAARSARLSYLTQHNSRPIEGDVSLHDDLVASGHMSPLEHVATPFTEQDMKHIADIQSGNYPDWIKNAVEFHGNFRGWHQYRKFIPHEDNFGARADT